MEFTGGTVFFGADAAVTDVTAAVDYLEADLMLMRLQCSPWLLHARITQPPMSSTLVKGQSDETSILAEMTNLGLVLAPLRCFVRTHSSRHLQRFDPYLHHLIQHRSDKLKDCISSPAFFNSLCD